MESKISKRNTTKFLKYVFTEEEKRELAENMARKVTEADELEGQKKTVTSEYAAKINSANTEAQSTAKKLTSGFEMRQIDCEEQLDYDQKEVTTIRLDDGEIVETRTMSNLELQQSLDLKEAA